MNLEPKYQHEFVGRVIYFQAEDGIRNSSVTGVQTCAFFFSSRRRHTRFKCDWSSYVCSSDLSEFGLARARPNSDQFSPCAAMQSIQPCLARLPSRMLLVSAILRAVRASQTIRASGRPTHPHAKRLPSTLRCQLHGPRVLRNSNRERKLRVAQRSPLLWLP